MNDFGKHVTSVSVFAAFALLALGSQKSSGGSSSSEPASAPAARTPAMEVTATQLFNDYHANEISADTKYKGKVIAVKGTIAGIKKDFMDNMIVEIATPNQFMSVHAELDSSEKSMAAQLSKGQPIRLVCNGKGLIVGSPSLDGCTK